MTEEDLGSRLSELIREQADVDLPPSLAASVAGIPRLGRGHRRTRRLLGTAVAVCAAIVMAGALVGPRLWANPPVAASPSGTIPATPVHVLTEEELRAAIEAQTAGGLEPWDVVADVSIDTSRRPDPLSRPCDSGGECQVIGTLQGFDGSDGTVAIRQEESTLPPATDAASLQSPVALRLTGSGPIEFLGHMRLAPSGEIAWAVTQVVADTPSAADEQVVAVDGWLEGAAGFSCGPAPEPGVPRPFTCGIHDYITAVPRPLLSAEGGNGRALAPPSDSIAVQRGAYASYAPNPSYDNASNGEPRRAIYFLRLVAFQGPGCTDCRGWLVVGRLDPSAVASPTGNTASATAAPASSS